MIGLLRRVFNRRPRELSIHDPEYVIPRARLEEVVRLIVRETSFENGFHETTGPTRAALLAHGFSPTVYVGISPEVELRREIDRSTYPARPKEYGLPAHYTVDVQGLGLRAEPGAERAWRHLYWEQGGGGLDSGRPHRAQIDIRSGEVR